MDIKIIIDKVFLRYDNRRPAEMTAMEEIGHILWGSGDTYKIHAYGEKAYLFIKEHVNRALTNGVYKDVSAITPRGQQERYSKRLDPTSSNFATHLAHSLFAAEDRFEGEIVVAHTEHDREQSLKMHPTAKITERGQR
jgi:hypothetical protein